MNTVCIFLICCFASAVTFAENDAYYDNHDNGWHWYDDPAEEQEIERLPAKTSSASPATVSATEENASVAKDTN